MHIENERKVGMMCGWPNQSNAAGWRTHIPFPAFARCNVSKGCSVIRMRGSSPWFAGEKNDLRHLRDGASQLVRPNAAAGAGFVLRRSPHLPRLGGSSGRLPPVWRGEARAAGVPGRERAPHEALCLVRGPALPHGTIQRRCRGAAPGLADGQGAGQGLHARTDPARRTPGPKVIGIDEISIRKGHTYRIVVSDLDRRRPIWFGGDDRSEASMDQFYRFLGEKKAKSIRLAVMDMWKAFRNSTHQQCPAGGHPVRQVPCAEAPRRSARQGSQDRIRAPRGQAASVHQGSEIHSAVHPQNLTGTARKNLKLLLAANKRLNTAYLLKESFGQLWDYNREAWARKFFENWRASSKWQRLKPYENFADMIERHWDGIAAYCKPENKVSLGFVEGLNNKIRVIQRRAYGLRDEEYLRLKVLTCMLPKI